MFSAPGLSAADSERELFKKVYPEVEKGNWTVVDQLDTQSRERLEQYLLWPDLRATWYRATLRTTDRQEIETFLDTYGTLKPARDLRYRYALHLFKSGLYDDYLRIYRSYYQGLNATRLDCHALHAELEKGSQRLLNRALSLWMVGKSQIDECDPVFDQLKDQFTTDDFRARFALALDSREFRLARWLGKSIDQAHVDVANQWLDAQTDPESFARNALRTGDGDIDQLAYAIERVTYRDPRIADDLWRKLKSAYHFSDKLTASTERHIALWLARDGFSQGYAALLALPPEAADEEVSRWRARVSLQDENWLNLIADIKAMPGDEAADPQWQYWLAHALRETGNDSEAGVLFRELSTDRSYYGFLAADAISAPYVFEHESLSSNAELRKKLAGNKDLLRARELFLVGLEGRARSEWEAVTSLLDEQRKLEAATLAHEWGWHSRAIATASSVGEYDDLHLRYPLPYRESFALHSGSANISLTWAYGIARSESLFMRDVRSVAGAVGLMQLMPSTGKRVARRLNVSYRGLDTLTNPESNIQLGSHYLGSMAQRYGGNIVAATAAYNAGPLRVDKWLPTSGSTDARVWIENIPFNETRGYVRRVLAAEAIFHWRLTGKQRRLSENLKAIKPAGEPVANR